MHTLTQCKENKQQNKFQTAAVPLYRLIRDWARPLWAVGQVSDGSSLMCATVRLKRSHLLTGLWIKWALSRSEGALSRACWPVSCVTPRGSLLSRSQQLFHVSPPRPPSGCRWFQLKYLSLNVVKPAFSGQEMPAARAWCHREHKGL